ncbi:Src y 2 domains-containing protein [Mactra antiquata]
MSDGSEYQPHKTLCRGWLEHKSIKSGSKYKRLWALLEGNVVFIFSTDQPSDKTQIGNITLTDKTEFITKPGGTPSKGYKFEIHGNSRITRFRTKKSTERELWRGYIIGIATGHVPPDLDLLEQDLFQIQDDIEEYNDTINNPIPSKRQSKCSYQSGKESGVFSIGDNSSAVHSSSNSSRSSCSGAASTLSGGGPIQEAKFWTVRLPRYRYGQNNRGDYSYQYDGRLEVHMFYKDRQKNKTPPSWFVPHCSRELAEKLLEKTNNLDYGNTLMRESKTYLQDGSYVITRIFVNANGKISYDHYEVIRTVEGYKVNVQNPHSPMKCLHDVLDYYINTSESGSKPIITNDLATLELDTPGYATEIYQRRHSQPKPRISSGTDVMEPEPDYDDAESEVKPSTATPNRQLYGSNTLSPGILRQESRPSGTTGRKSVCWNSVVKTPPPLPQHHTHVPGFKQQTRPLAPSVDEFKQRQRETDQLNDFDQMINSYEKNEYYNTSSELGLHDRHLRSDQNNVQQSLSTTATSTSLPPPPAPHHFNPLNSHSYVNQDTELKSIDALPVAPPPPRDPIVSKASKPTVSSQLKHSVSMVEQPAKHVPASISKSPSEGQIKKNLVSLTSPQNFPVWSNTAGGINSVNTNVPEKPINVGSVNTRSSEADGEGVDENNPGGVSTLREKFNLMASPSQAVTKKAEGGRPPFVRKSTEPSIALQNQTRTPPVVPDNGPPLPDTNHPVDNRLTQRRQTEPAIVVSRDQLKALQKSHDDSGFNDEFKKKLGALFGGASQNSSGAVGTGRVVPKIPTNQRNSHFQRQDTEEHLYQELPEIEPDGVTYVNEQYNTETVDRT